MKHSVWIEEALVLAIHEGPEQGWTAPITVVAAAAGILGAAAFVAVELRRELG